MKKQKTVVNSQYRLVSIPAEHFFEEETAKCGGFPILFSEMLEAVNDYSTADGVSQNELTASFIKCKR